MPDTSFEKIWTRIIENAGEKFYTKRGLPFTYKIVGEMFIPSRTDYMISKNDIKKTYQMLPLSGPGEISQIVRGPSYLWAVLYDKKISKGEW